MDGTVRNNPRLASNLEDNSASIPPSVHDHHIRIYAAASSLIVILWVGLVLLVPDLHFVIFTPRAKTGFEATLAFLQLFVALVLVLFPDKFERDRFRWLALGFLILGIGGLGFGYLLTLTDRATDLNVTMYGSLLTSLLSTLMIAIGLVPQQAPNLQTRRTVFVLGLFLSLGVATVLLIDYLPLLSTVDDLESAAASDAPVLEGLTSWHWGISLLPVAIGALAAIAAVRRPYGSANGELVGDVHGIAHRAPASHHVLASPPTARS
ncbi:MAG: hypothetical protein R2845_01220 [Thermomicrobiales bacterium]